MIRSQITLKQLEAFAFVVDTGTFRAAASALGTTQPNISSRITALETALDVALLYRDAGSVRLTERGQELLSLTRDILRAGEALLEAAHVVHYDLKAKNTVIQGDRLTAIDFDLATLDGRPSLTDLSDRRSRTRTRTAYGPALREARAERCALERKSAVLWNRDNRRRREAVEKAGGPTHVSARLRQRREAVEKARERQREFRRDQALRLAAARRPSQPDASDDPS